MTSHGRHVLRVIRLSLTLILVFSGTILAIHLMGGMFPNPIAVLFTNPDGSPCQMPCLLGVRPGEMTVDEGLNLLSKHPLTRGMTIGNHSPSGALLFSKDAYVTINSVNAIGIDTILLGYNMGDKGTLTPDLASAMAQANPGNQYLFWGHSIFYDSESGVPSSINEYCYAHGSICFVNGQPDNRRAWQTEGLTYLTVRKGPSN